jgi:hypothetical protein
MPGQSQKAGWKVGVTAPVGHVRGLFRARPWAGPCPSVGRTALEPGAHGRIADGGGPRTRLERRMRWSVPGDSGRSDGL